MTTKNSLYSVLKNLISEYKRSLKDIKYYDPSKVLLEGEHKMDWTMLLENKRNPV